MLIVCITVLQVVIMPCVKKEGESLHGSTMLFSIVLTVWNISTAVNKLVFTLFQGWTEEMESGNFFQTGLCFAALFSKFTWW